MSWAECGALAAQTDWDNMIYPATVMLAMLTDNQAFHTAAQGYLQKWLCRCLLLASCCCSPLPCTSRENSIRCLPQMKFKLDADCMLWQCMTHSEQLQSRSACCKPEV